MMPSRGMGAVRPAVIRKIKKRDGDEPVTLYKKGGEVWDKPRPEGLGKPKKLTPSQKQKAKAFAKRTGTKYPSLVANMQAARKK